MLLGPVEPLVAVLGAVRQHARVHRALVEHAVRPHDAALLVHQRVAPAVDVLHDVVEPLLELRQAVHREQVDRAGLLVRWRRHVGRRRAVLDAVAVVGERIGARAVDALAVVLLQAGEVAVGDRDHLLPGRAAAPAGST